MKKSSTDLKLKKSEILFEDNHLIIINKKSGILVQGDITGDISLIEITKSCTDHVIIKASPGAIVKLLVTETV